MKSLKGNKVENLKKFHRLVLVRNGETQWSFLSTFSGWFDCQLSKKGISQAKLAGKLLKSRKISFDTAYSSLLCRAQDTLKYILEGMGNDGGIETKLDWRLNERHLGALTGLTRQNALRFFLEEEIDACLSTFRKVPPIMKDNHPCYRTIVSNVAFAGLRIPSAESMEMCYHRLISLYRDKLFLDIKFGKDILIVAHESSLRCLLKYFLNMSDENTMKMLLPFAKPFILPLDINNGTVYGALECLGEEDHMEKKIRKSKKSS